MRIKTLRCLPYLLIGWLLLYCVPDAHAQVTASGTFAVNTVGQTANLVSSLPSGAAAASVTATTTSGTLACSTYPLLSFYVSRNSQSYDLADLSTIGPGTVWTAYPNFVQLLQGDQLFAKITQAGVGCTNLLPLTVSVTYMPAAGLCYGQQSACVTLIGTLAGANGISSGNYTVTFSPSQVGSIGGAAPGTTNPGPVHPYYVPFAVPGKPAANLSLPVQTFANAVNFPADFATAAGTVGTDPTATAVFTILKNGLQVKTASISTLGVFTFASVSDAAVSFAVNDRLTIQTPVSQDATLSDVAFTLSGTVGQ